MTIEKAFELDLDQITLDDFIMLEEFVSGNFSAAGLKRLLTRCLTNWTEEEIGGLTIPELKAVSDALGEAMEKTMSKAVPPESGGGS